MPPEAQNFKWEGSRRVITYTLPPVKAPADRNVALLTAAAALGVVLTVWSFFVKPQSTPRGA